MDLVWPMLVVDENDCWCRCASWWRRQEMRQPSIGAARGPARRLPFAFDVIAPRAGALWAPSPSLLTRDKRSAMPFAAIAGPIADVLFRSKRQLIGRYRARRTQVYCIGSAKSGTHSIAAMF